VGLTKLRLVAAAAGILLGLGGVFALAIGLTLALAKPMGLIGATFTIAALLVAGAITGFYVFLTPKAATAAAPAKQASTPADMLARLPMEAARAVIQKYPLGVSAAALLVGYTVIRNPELVRRQVERLITNLI
jgi:hypothetical protein